MKTITIGEIKQGLNTKCHIKLLLSFKVFLSGIYRNASLCWKHTDYFFPVYKLAIISFIIKAEPSFLSISKAIPWHLFCWNKRKAFLKSMMRRVNKLLDTWLLNKCFNLRISLRCLLHNFVFSFLNKQTFIVKN